MGWSNRSRCFKVSLITAIVLVVLILVVVPPSVVLTRHHAPAAAVMLPLYVYPSEGALNPLYKAIEARPNLQFTLIVNPNSGPGNTSFPGNEFATAFEKLNTYANVQTVGYVRTNYSSRPIDEVKEDISRYSSWSSNKTANKLYVEGIFFDETVSVYSDTAAQYMANITAFAKNQAPGLMGKKLVSTEIPKTPHIAPLVRVEIYPHPVARSERPWQARNQQLNSACVFSRNPGTVPANFVQQVVTNPGVIQESGLLSPSTDVTVVFEGPYNDLPGKRQTALDALPNNRTSKAYIVYQAPSSINLGGYVGDLTKQAGYVFVTNNNNGDYYNTFGSNFDGFVNAVPT